MRYLLAVFRIRTGSEINWVSSFGSGSRKAKIIHEKRKNTTFRVVKVLDIHFGGLESVGFSCRLNAQAKYKLLHIDKKKLEFFKTVNIFFWHQKTDIWVRIRLQQKTWIRIRIQ